MNQKKVLIETETITAARVRQLLYFPAMEEKLPLLISPLSRTEDGRCMVFVNTKVWVERVARALEKAHYRLVCCRVMCRKSADNPCWLNSSVAN